MQDTGAVLDLLSIQHRIKDGKIALEYRYRDSVRNKEIYLYEGVIFNMLQFVLSSSTPYIHTTSSQGRITVHMQIDNFSRSMLNILQDVYIPNL